MGNHATISLAGSQGHFELNVFKPVIIASILQSIRLLTDATNSFVDHCVEGIKANTAKLKENLENSLMLVTALNPIIGYDKASQIAKKALHDNISLREAAEALHLLTGEEFNKYVVPEQMV